MAVAIPQAFGDLAPLFACSYVALQVLRNAFNVYATPRDNDFHIVFRRILVWSSPRAPCGWPAGSRRERPASWLWIAALAVDYAAPSLGYWTPRLGRSATTEWEIEPAHFAERFQLFIIIALGESIVVTGATASSLALDLAIGTSLMVAFATSAACGGCTSTRSAGARSGSSRGSMTAAGSRATRTPTCTCRSSRASSSWPSATRS